MLSRTSRRTKTTTSTRKRLLRRWDDRVRERWVMRRTAVVNQIRGLLLERGITLPKGRRHVDAALPGILTDPATKLSGTVLVLLTELKLELAQLAEKIDRADKSMEKIAQENEACQRLVKMPGG